MTRHDFTSETDWMRGLDVVSRRQWGARGAPKTAQTISPLSGIVFVHHSAFFGMSIDSKPEQILSMQRMEQFHMSKGWNTIGYSFVVFQPNGALKRATIYEGRGWQFVPAAQLNHNTGNGAICVVGDFTSETLKRNTRYKVGKLARTFPGQRMGMHKQVFGTECPGPNIERWMDRIARVAGKTLI